MFIDENSADKMKLVSKQQKMHALFEELFDPEMAKWISDEIKLNRQDPVPPGQKEFWKPPVVSCQHDPRGCQKYVTKFVDTYLMSALKSPEQQGLLSGAVASNGAHIPEMGASGTEGPLPQVQFHRPHPNIEDYQLGRLVKPVNTGEKTKKGKKKQEREDYSEEELKAMVFK